MNFKRRILYIIISLIFLLLQACNHASSSYYDFVSYINETPNISVLVYGDPIVFEYAVSCTYVNSLDISVNEDETQYLILNLNADIKELTESFMEELDYLAEMGVVVVYVHLYNYYDSIIESPYYLSYVDIGDNVPNIYLFDVLNQFTSSSDETEDGFAIAYILYSHIKYIESK